MEGGEGGGEEGGERGGEREGENNQLITLTTSPTLPTPPTPPTEGAEGIEGKSSLWLHSRPDVENYLEENLIQDRYNSLFILHPHVHFIGEAKV